MSTAKQVLDAPTGAFDLSRPSSAARRRQLKERLIEVAVTAIGLSGIAVILLIMVFVAKEALPLLYDAAHHVEVTFNKLFLAQPGRRPFVWQPVGDVPKVSMIPLFIGTAKVTVVAMAVAVPMGLAAAVFTAEFAPQRVREVVKPVIELLAGIPSVVLGFFALVVFASSFKDALGYVSRLNALVAGIGLALAIIPVVFTVCEDALNAVPRSYREAALALGANRWEMTRDIVLPAAAPGILAACILGFGRAIGETMIVLMASGNAAIVSASPFDSTRSMSATIASEMGEVVVGSSHYALLFLIGIELFAVTFVLNWLGGAWLRAWARKLAGRTRQ